MAGVVKAGGEGVGARCKDESMAEVNLGRDRKKMFGWKGDTLRPEALKCAEGAVCGRVVHAAVVRSGGERSWSCAAVNRSTTTIAPPHLTAPQRLRCRRGGRFRFAFRWSGLESGEAPWQHGGAFSVGEEAEVADADEALGEQMK